MIVRITYLERDELEGKVATGIKHRIHNYEPKANKQKDKELSVKILFESPKLDANWLKI